MEVNELGFCLIPIHILALLYLKRAAIVSKIMLLINYEMLCLGHDRFQLNKIIPFVMPSFTLFEGI